MMVLAAQFHADTIQNMYFSTGPAQINVLLNTERRCSQCCYNLLLSNQGWLVQDQHAATAVGALTQSQS